MKISLGKLKNSEEALTALSNCPLPIVLSYKISKALKVIASELTLLEESRKSLVQKYGVVEGNDVIVSKENIDAFMKELNPLLMEEVDIPIEPIPIGSLPDNLSLTPIQISQLSYFIVD
jgi:hypothetical protein